MKRSLQQSLCVPCRRRLMSTQSGGKTAVFFPGQGSQQVGMLKPWTEKYASARALVAELDDAVGFPLSQMINEGPPDKLNYTEHAQPAILLQSSVIVRVLKEEFDIDLTARADYALGHSLGEFTALTLSGILTPAASIKLVRERGIAMRKAAEALTTQSGRTASMIALVVEKGRSRFVVDRLRQYRLDRNLDATQEVSQREVLCVANHNSDSQVVVAGYDDLLKDFVNSLKQFDGRDPRAIKLPLSAPFHTPIMWPAQRQIQKYLDEQVRFSVPAKVPLISNVSSLPLPADETACKKLIARGCTETVRWLDSCEYLRDHGVERYISIGPSQVARKLVESIVGAERVLHVQKPEECDALAKALTT